MSVLRIEGQEYPFPLEEILADLTGKESMMLEDYLGGWENFDPRSGTTRSVIVIVWLAKHFAGEDVDLDEIAEMKGLVFGDTVEPMKDDDARPPAEESPSSSAETSESNGAPLLESSTT